MKRAAFVIGFLLFMITSLWAKEVSKDIARDVALNFFSERGNHLALGDEIEIAESGITLLYVFNAVGENGFVVVAADDCVRPVLSFSYKGSFNPNEIPEGYNVFIEGFKSTILEERNLKSSDVKELAEWEYYKEGKFLKNGTVTVEPLLSDIHWSQGTYYSADCPYDESAGKNCKVGCVATMMGQVIKYWGFPQNGTGSHSYESTRYGTLSADFNVDYNIDAMPGRVTSDNPDVAKLCYHLGVSVNMQFGPESSGSYFSSASPALRNYFKYSGCDFIKRKNYSDSQWAAMLKENLDQALPVLYGGQSSSSGHAFVIDGYQGNGTYSDFFHFNFGWGGYSDTYNTIDGIKYNLKQEAIINVRPSNGSDTGGNRAPIARNEIEDISLEEGFGVYQIALGNYFSDPDGDALTYNISIDNTRVVSLSSSGGILNLQEVGIGIVNVSIKVTDGNGESVSDSFVVEVVKKPVRNQIPVVDQKIPNQDFDEGFVQHQIVLSDFFSDADSDPLIYSASVVNKDVVTISVSGNRLILQEVGVGQTDITVTVGDGKGGIVSQTILVEVHEVNKAPVVVKSQDDINLENGSQPEVVDLSEIFEDPDGDNITYFVELSNNEIVDAELQGSELIIQDNTIGETQATVVAKDQKGAEKAISFNIQVSQVTNIDSVISDNWSTVYPNPAREFISIDIDLEEEGAVSMWIFNSQGKQVSQNQFNSIYNTSNIDISSLNPGMYIVKLRCNGKEMVLRFVKE